MAQVPLCSLCGTPVLPNMELADRQGQPIEIKFAAYTVRLTVCEDCIKPLEPYRQAGERYPGGNGGTLPILEALPYMARVETDEQFES